MRESEFSGYLDYFVPAYASEISSSHRLSYSESLVQAKLEIADDLPDGINTADNLCCACTIRQMALKRS